MPRRQEAILHFSQISPRLFLDPLKKKKKQKKTQQTQSWPKKAHFYFVSDGFEVKNLLFLQDSSQIFRYQRF